MEFARNLKLIDAWQQVLAPEFSKPYMKTLQAFLTKQQKSSKRIFPAEADYFSALNLTSLDDVKVVILGQDPYHGEGQAHGLCFSVLKGVSVPPSLRNIYKELKTDIRFEPPSHGYLEEWSRQGVLMLNSVLTVEKGKAGSHQNKGWEDFTDKIISILNDRDQPVAFLLWGAYAQKKGSFIDEKKHFVLRSAHPSPFSAHRGFLGSRPFSKVNQFLESKGQKPIRWQLSH